MQFQIHGTSYWGIIKRNAWVVFICLVVSAALTILAFLMLPKKFKSAAVIDIQSSYFRTPLVGDLISEVWDPGEVKAQRLTLLRLAINDAFLESLGEEFNLFISDKDTSARAMEKERLRSQIEYFSVGSTSYQISATSAHARQAFEINSAVLAQVQNTLLETRRKNLVRTRDVIQKHAEQLDSTLGTLEMGGKGVKSPRELKLQLAAVLGNIEALKGTFSAKHPRMKALERKRQQLQQQLGGRADGLTQEPSSRSYIGKQGKQPTQDVYYDLLRKLSYLNVVIDMEGEAGKNLPSVNIVQEAKIPLTPLSPNITLLGAVGFLVAMVSSIVLTLFFELRRGTFQSPRQASSILQAPFLGELPPLYTGQAPKLLTAGRQEVTPVLPYVNAQRS